MAEERTAALPADLEAVLRSLIEKPARVDELARHAPRVKSIVEDAREWEETYAAVLKGRDAISNRSVRL